MTANDLEITRVLGEENISDILTKAVTTAVPEGHMATMGLVTVDRREKQKLLG